MNITLTEGLLIAILFVLSIIVVIFFATIYRRASQSSRYRELDRKKDLYAKIIQDHIQTSGIPRDLSGLASKVDSTEWHAVEHVLLEMMGRRDHENEVKSLFETLGYADHYEKNLGKKNVITKASAIDMLGKMRCERSLGKLVGLLQDENPEIVTVTVRAIGKIGSAMGLRRLLEEMPRLLSNSLVTVKTIETSLAHFGGSSVAILVEYGEKCDDPLCKALLLEVLSSAGPGGVASLALSNLQHPDPEVRSRALKVLGAAGDGLEGSVPAKAETLLSDPVWFVRLQAARAMGNLGYEAAIDKLGDALLDKNWQVRNAAATALTKFGNRSLSTFLGTLMYRDRYAKESICEEIQKTGFIDILFDNLHSGDAALYAKSRQVLEIMKSLDYCTPLLEYADAGTNETTRFELQRILNPEKTACP
jgi:HEAT repeat protein